MIAPSSSESVQQDIRPLVARVGGYPRWMFLLLLAVSAGLLFYVLESRRERVLAPAFPVSVSDYPDISDSVSPLAIPQDGAGDEFEADQISRRLLRLQSASGAIKGSRYIQAGPVGQRDTPSQSHSSANGAASWIVPPPVPYPLSDTAGQMYAPAPTALAGQSPPAIDTPDTRGDTAGGDGKERVKASRLVNPGTTIAKGTVIQAVLETALDSTRAGFARALVSRDVFSLDGSIVLVPRGSRIIGEYKSDLNLGQSRVLIQWQRLSRPDGVIVDMDSPSADPLGRAGIAGQVNNHFLQRFAGAILQSALNVGTQLASQRVSRDAIYIGVPGATQGLLASPDKIQPTVKVKQGSSVSVFVARDLDFTAVQ